MGDPSGRDRRQFLQDVEDVIRSEVTRQAAAREATPRRRRPAVAWACAAALVAVAAWAAVARPAWLLPDRPPEESAELRRASLRIALYMDAQRVKLYRSEHGVLPATLAEAGSPNSVFRLERGPEPEFTITGASGADTITLRSDQPEQEFLGNSFALLKRRSTP